MAAVFLITISLGAAVDRLIHTPQACLFVHAYQSVQRADVPMTVWERLLYSLALAHARASSTQSRHAPITWRSLT